MRSPKSRDEVRGMRDEELRQKEKGGRRKAEGKTSPSLRQSSETNPIRRFLGGSGCVISSRMASKTTLN